MVIRFVLSLAPGLALSLTLLAPLSARAITVTSPQSSGTSSAAIYIGHEACLANLSYQFNYTLDVAPNTGDQITLAIVHTASDCSVAPIVGAGDQQVGSPSQTSQTGSYSATAGALALAQTADGGLAGGCNDTTHTSSSPYTTYFCVQNKPAATLTTTTPTFGSLAVNFSLVPPTEPASVGAESGDSHLRISWAAGNSSENILMYQVFVVPKGGAVDLNTTPTKVSATTTGFSADTSATQDGTALVNGTAYDVYVRAQDVYLNFSSLSVPVSALPLAVDDFYNHYRSVGGSALGGGGCSTGGGAGLAGWIGALVLSAGLWTRRRKLFAKGRAGSVGRKGFIQSGLLGLSLFFLAPGAQAQSQYGAPPRRLMISFKLDRYDPKIDSEKGLNGATPYLDIFGTRKPFRFQIEGDWEIAHPFGSFLLGLTAGYWQNIGKGYLHDKQTPSTDTALLDIIPFGLVATYRFDYLADRFRWFPLVPYAQAGLQGALWSSFNGTGNVSRRPDPGGNGRGSSWTYGYTTALGLSFALDAIDPSLSREAYNDTYIQRTAIFAEYGWTRLDDFQHHHPLILSDRGWRFGLSLEF